MEQDQSISNFIPKLELTMSKLWELGDTTFFDVFMISKLTTNLPTKFDSFIAAWENTPKNDHNLVNLKLRLQKEEKKILYCIQ